MIGCSPSHVWSRWAWPARQFAHDDAILRRFPAGGAANVAMAVEAMYTTALRTASALSRAKRADLRLTWFPVAVVVRYAEYLADGDGVLTAFSDAYAGKTLWILGGVGF